MPKLSIECIIHFAIILHEPSFSHLLIWNDFNLKIVIIFGTLSNTKPINCVGVQTFEHSKLKFTC